MTNTKTVPLELPLDVWGRLASLADRRGIRIADLVADAVTALVPAPKPQRGDGYTGAPGHRLEVLQAEMSAVRRDRLARGRVSA